jgi:ABC-2 type transport system permease protein
MSSENHVARSWMDGALRGPAVVLLSILVTVMVNYISSRHYVRWDWTSEQRFTLSSRSREIARALKAPTEMFVLMTREEEQYTEVVELAERYASVSQRLQVHTIDPDRQRDRFVGLAQRFNLQTLTSREGDRTIATSGILVAQGSRHWEVSRETLRELGHQDPNDEQGTSLVLNARITVERSLSEALLQVDRAQPTKLCFAQGHAEMPIAQGDRSGQGFAEDLRHHNFQVREVEVRGNAGVPSDCDALVIAGPQRAWPEEDAQALERYLRSGGNVALFVDLVVLEGTVAPTGLERVVALAGIALPAAATIETDRGHLLREGSFGQFRIDTWNDHEITNDLRGSSMIVELLRPVIRAPGSVVVPQSLAQSTTGAWGETAIRELGSRGPSQDPADIAGPIHAAMASTVPGVSPRTEGAPAGRLVVVGTSLMLETGYFAPTARATFSNAVFSEAVVGWITARRELVNIPSRPISRAALMVSPNDLLQIGLYVIVLVPLAAALVGVAVWRSRRMS